MVAERLAAPLGMLVVAGVRPSLVTRRDRPGHFRCARSQRQESPPGRRRWQRHPLANPRIL